MSTEELKNQYRLIQERYVKAAWTHKIHEKQADAYYSAISKNKTCLAVAASVTSVSAISSFLVDLDLEWISTLITVVASMVTTYYSFRYKDNVLEDKAQASKQYASNWLTLRNAYESFMADIKSNRYSEDNQIYTRRDELERQLQAIQSIENIPEVESKSVDKARKALLKDKDTQTSDEEIKTIVPLHLQDL